MLTRQSKMAACVGVAAAALALAALVIPRAGRAVTPANAFRHALEADPQHRSALRVRRVMVPDLVGQPVTAAEAFVATVPRARLSIGGAGPVILFQRPSAGALLADDGAYFAVTLGEEEQLAAAKDPAGQAAAGTANAAAAAYPTPPDPRLEPPPPVTTDSTHQVRDPRDAEVRPPPSYPSVEVVITYEAAPPTGGGWSWKLVDTRTATIVGTFPVRAGDGCRVAERQRLAAPLAAAGRPDDEVTVELDRRVGTHEERVAASTVLLASTYRGGGVVLFDNAGRLATNPTGDSRC